MLTQVFLHAAVHSLKPAEIPQMSQFVCKTVSAHYLMSSSQSGVRHCARMCLCANVVKKVGA